jgi:hypothetical protein
MRLLGRRGLLRGRQLPPALRDRFVALLVLRELAFIYFPF